MKKQICLSKYNTGTHFTKLMPLRAHMIVLAMIVLNQSTFATLVLVQANRTILTSFGPIDSVGLIRN